MDATDHKKLYAPFQFLKSVTLSLLGYVLLLTFETVFSLPYNDIRNKMSLQVKTIWMAFLLFIAPKHVTKIDCFFFFCEETSSVYLLLYKHTQAVYKSHGHANTHR